MDFRLLKTLGDYLDHPHPLGIDWKLLAADFGLDINQILSVQSKGNPTEGVIRNYETETGKEWDDIVNDIRVWADRNKRIDVRNAIDKYVSQKSEKEKTVKPGTVDSQSLSGCTCGERNKYSTDSLKDDQHKHIPRPNTLSSIDDVFPAQFQSMRMDEHMRISPINTRERGFASVSHLGTVESREPREADGVSPRHGLQNPLALSPGSSFYSDQCTLLNYLFASCCFII